MLFRFMQSIARIIAMFGQFWLDILSFYTSSLPHRIGQNPDLPTLASAC
jgi:hypothetical protein